MITKQITELRKGRGENGRTLSKSMLSRVSGVGRNVINRMEKGEGRFSYTDVEKVFKALGFKIIVALDDNE
jgi:predicted transcriptional regulator